MNVCLRLLDIVWREKYLGNNPFFLSGVLWGWQRERERASGCYIDSQSTPFRHLFLPLSPGHSALFYIFLVEPAELPVADSAGLPDKTSLFKKNRKLRRIKNKITMMMNE